MQNSKMLHSRKKKMLIAVGFGVLLIFAGFLSSSNNVVGSGPKATTHTVVNVNMATFEGKIMPADDATEANDGWVRIYFYPRSNELGDIVNYENPQTTQPSFLVDKIGTSGNTGISRGSTCDCQGFPTEWALGEDLVCVIDKNTASGGYTGSSDMIIDSNDPQEFPYSKLYKIPSVTFTGSSIDWSLPSGWDANGNVYGFRIYEATAEAGPYSVIGNVTGNTTTTFSYSPTIGYWYKISVLYRGQQGGVEDYTTVIESLYTGAPAQYTLPLTVTVNAPDGGEIWMGSSTHDISYTISGGTPNYNVWLNYSTSGLAGPWNPCSGPAQPVTQTGSGTSTYAWTLPSADSTNCYARVEVVDSSSNSASDNSNTAFTIDSTSPYISLTTPADSAAGVALNQNVAVQFSEKMNITTVTYECTPDPLGWSPSWNSPTNTILTLTHNNFNPSTTYEFNVTAGKDVAGNDLAPGVGTTTYSFTGVTTAGPHDAYACDVDVFPFAGDAANRNTMVEATDAQYTAISSSDNSRWTTIDPGNGDQIFMWFEINSITESPAAIVQIDFTFEGYSALASDMKIYVMKAGADWTLSASWVQVGGTMSFAAGVDSTMMVSLTSGFSTYIDGTGKLVWGVYQVVSSEALNVDYVCVKITSTTSAPNPWTFTTVTDNPPTSSASVAAPYWKTSAPFNVGWSASDDNGLTAVALYYRYSTDNATWGGWTLFARNESVSGLSASGTFSFTAPSGNGYYEFYTLANDTMPQTEAAPASADAVAGLDSVAPSSSVNAISPYWQTASPLTITATASDTVSGLASVELWHRYSTDNSTWGGWSLFGTDTASPWSWSFNFPNGTGYYQFYSRAKDNATNYEAAPGSADAICGYDNTVPTSSVNVISPYWQTTSPITITATASDTVSGLASVELWYRYSTDNVTWGGWSLFGTDTVAPWSWSFGFPNGTSYYEFYSRAKDNATNYESAPGVRDALCGFDNAAPTSSVNIVSPYWQTVSPLTVSASASDGVSGLASVELWYRYSADNVTFGGWVLFGTDTASPWQWSFNFPNGTGYYQFYSRARDNATNYEAAPGSADAICGYDNAVPTSNVNTISPYWQTTSPLTITGTASDTGYSGLASVELWYRYSADNVTFGGWVLFGTDSVSPWSWSFTFPNGTGYYQFYSRARDNATNYEAAPGSRDALCGYDNSAPTSSVDVISPYWQNTSPITITATASDTVSGLASVELWYRYSADNTTFGGWVLFGTDTASPWSWSFTFSNGTGYYEFYTRARDNATNYESAPGSADALCGYDNAVPTSNVNVISPYWQTASPLTITGTASDTGYSGLASVELWHRYSTDNSTWGGWVLFGTDTASPWQWSFNFPNGTGYYEFYSRAKDNATNYESAPGVRDALCGFDNAAPTSSVNVISPYWQIITPFTVSASASDGVSGLASVELWYRYSADNVTFGGWTSFGTDTVSPWSWSFSFPNGTGYYEFYSRAKDNATNYESAPGVRDALCGFDNAAPTSSVNVISPYWQNTSPITITATASDTVSGLASVELWHRYSTDNSTWGGWVLFGTDSVSPWSWSFSFPNGTGYYEFYSRARDTATNYEAAPASRDALCGYDNAAPTSSVNIVSPYWQIVSPLTVTATASDAVSGLASVELWHRYSTDNVTWGGWVLSGTDTVAPWSWSFAFSNGTGYYEFYTRARDTATNYESAPGSRDALCGYDNVAPASSVNVISPYWQTASPITIIATASDTLSGLASVELWYRYSTDNTSWGGWGLFGTDSVSPWQWSFSFSNGTGYYEFYSRARDNATNYESAPGGRDALCGYDNSAPTSSVDVISPYWQNTSPITITATASDTVSGLASVELWYRYSIDNTTFGDWVLLGTDTAAPWSWSFTFSNGTGYYEFYTRARDNATNYESAPASRDALCGYDNAVPTSNVNVISPYWQTVSPLTITATASDTVSGLASVELWYRYSTDNTTFGGWVLFGADTTSPWSWLFTFSNGTGYYQFYSRAKDNATNYESAPGTADAICGYDNVAPSSSVNAISPYWQTASPLSVTATASDAVSGLGSVELWYRYSVDNTSWGGWVLFGTDSVSPWSWSFNFPNGTGYYEFYSRARDVATNYEAAPASRDALCGYDSVIPSSSVNVISPYWQTASPITITATASDTLSGLASVELWYRYSTDNVTWGGWVLSGTDTVAPWSWSFAFSNGTGYYEFYTRARDTATNYESAPGSRDALCGYDNVAPASSVNVISPYWQTSIPLTITASASDGASGVKDVTLWYRYSADNITFGAWASFGTDSVSPWSWSFSAPSGDGYYEFYSIASDNAGLSESAPAGRDSLCGVDTNAPYIISTTPADGATGVSVTQNIIIQFSEKMNTSSVQYTCFPDPGGWVESWNPAKDTLTLNHNIFTGEVTYTFNVTIAKDPAGNAIATDRSFYAATSIAIGTVNNIANIQGSPDDLYADFTMGGNTETVSVAGSGYPTGIGVIVKVEIAAEYHVTGTVTDDQLRMKQNLGTFTNHDWLPSSTIDVTQYFDVTSEKPSWSWADISSMQVTLTNVKVGGGDTYIVYVDTVFVRVNYYNRWNFTAASGASATATGPTGYANTYPVTIVYSYSGTPDNVSLYYTIDGGTNWNFIGDDTTVDGSYGWTIPADGEYGWYAVANGGGSVETAPVSGTTPEASPYIVDTQLPTSSVAQISPYWKSSTPFAITATASDSLSGVKNVTLYYRHSSDNSSWGDWTSFGTDTVSPWSWSFTAPSSDGYYEFYSIAVDNSNNIEVAPASRDSLCGVDSNPPSSSVNTLSLYWQTASPLTITATASDTLSGLASVELWHRYSTDNVSWGGWSLFGTDTVSPWSWSFGFSNGTGYYEFYSRARDNATNYESAPASRDTLCGYDNAVPTSNVNVISPYWQTTSPITITATASDTVSGLASVELWYRYAVDNLTWGGWVLSGTDTASPWSWSFNFPNGTGYYEFYSRARDNATNYESAPASRDTLCGYDNAAPASSVNVISPYWQTTSPLTITGTASDTGYSGLASVELWYRYSTDNTSWGGWGLFGTDSVSPWQWSFSFSNGTGYYEFYSRSRDNATNYESAPGSRDALCGYDNAAPTSSVNVISPYWQTSTPFTVSASASDTMSGVKNVSLYYRFSSDNVTFGGWTSFGTDTVSPWSWSFTAPSGDGYYEFYSIASDNAGLIESAPGSADTICVVDTNAPYIISTTPADSATGVSVTQNIIIQFSEKMNTSSVEYTSFPDPGNWVGSWNATNDTLTLTHNDFTPEVTYTFNVTIAKDVAGHALVSGPVLNPWSFTIMTTTLPSAPTNVMAEKSGNDIILSWDPMYGADFYRVYRSPNVNGTGFSWTPVNETTSTSCIRPNELADSNNYSYVIRSVSNTAGENLTCSDMAFKLCFNFVAPVGLLHDNVFSLPYNTELTTASGLKSDIGANCSKVSKWNPVTQVWISYPFNNFPIEPGAGYKAVVTADTVYKIVGAHNSSVEHSFVAPVGLLHDNIFSLPYNTGLTTASGLKTSIGANCSKVSKWNPVTQVWISYPFNNFPIEPGAGYKAVVTADTTWRCPVNEPSGAKAVKKVSLKQQPKMIQYDTILRDRNSNSILYIPSSSQLMSAAKAKYTTVSDFHTDRVVSPLLNHCSPGFQISTMRIINFITK